MIQAVNRDRTSRRKAKPSLSTPPVRSARGTLVRQLALAKLRELQQAGMSYREIGLRFGGLRGSGAHSPQDFDLRPPPERLPRPPRPASGAALKVPESAHLQMLEVLDQGMAFVSRSGTLLHANAAARCLLESAAGPQLRREVHSFADLLWALVQLHGVQEKQAVKQLAVRQVRGGEERYRLEGSYIGGSLFGAGGSVLVAFERRAPGPLSDQTLQGHYGLTPQESRLARLLVEGKTNTQIAARLQISPHTARHHTQSVLRKLGARSRAEAAARLLALRSTTVAPGGE